MIVGLKSVRNLDAEGRDVALWRGGWSFDDKEWDSGIGATATLSWLDDISTAFHLIGMENAVSVNDLVRMVVSIHWIRIQDLRWEPADWPALQRPSRCERSPSRGFQSINNANDALPRRGMAAQWKEYTGPHRVLSSVRFTRQDMDRLVAMLTS